MAILSMFYGIVVRMFFFDDDHHQLPNIHVEYSGSRAVLEIPTGELLAGDMPSNKMRLVQAWIEIHRDELMANWRLAVNGEEIFRIEPLK